MKKKPPFQQTASRAAILACLWLTASSAEAQNPRTPEPRVQSWLRAQDANNDGRIAVSESTGAMKSNFRRNDVNKDGFLDKTELAALARRLGRGGARQGNRNVQARNQAAMSTEQMLRNAPANVVIEPDVAYRPGDSGAWRLDLVRPKDAAGDPRPGLVFVHGGGWRNGDKRRGYFLQGAIEYAQKGYVCVTVNYRLIDEAPFPACIEDVKCAVRWLRANAGKYNLDPKRIGGYGNSAGAHLVAMLGLAGPKAKLEGDGPHQDQSSLLQAVCASATPTDFSLFGGGRAGDAKFVNPKHDATELSRLSSPIAHVRADAPPFLLIHGTADRTVNVKHGDLFVEALKQAGAKDVTYLRINESGHGVFNEHASQTHPAMEAFFARTLGTPK